MILLFTNNLIIFINHIPTILFFKIFFLVYKICTAISQCGYRTRFYSIIVYEDVYLGKASSHQLGTRVANGINSYTTENTDNDTSNRTNQTFSLKKMKYFTLQE